MTLRFAARGALLVLVLFVGGLAPSPPSTAARSLRHAAGSVLFQAQWSSGLRQWRSYGGGWIVQGGLLRFGGRGMSALVAPYRVRRARYSLESRVRLVRYRGAGVTAANSFGMLFRFGVASSHGLGAGVAETRTVDGREYTAVVISNPASPAIDNSRYNYEYFNPGTSWHTYRLDVDGNNLSLSVDSRKLVDITVNQLRQGRRIGLYDTTSQIEIGSFKVLGR